MMRKISIILAFTLSSCSPHKSKTEVPINRSQVSNDMPPCLVQMIEKIKSDSTQQLPQSVTQYTYQGQTVFYVTAPCCDHYNTVYNSNCEVIGAPDGGFTGRGDGSLPDFFKQAANAKVVWKRK